MIRLPGRLVNMLGFRIFTAGKHSIMNFVGRIFFALAAFVGIGQCCRAVDYNDYLSEYSPDGVPFAVADSPWEADGLGNHRAVVRVPKGEHAMVRALLKWRRPDRQPEGKQVRVIDAATGEAVGKAMVLALSSEEGDVVFQPNSGHELYYVYYLPYNFRRQYGDARYDPFWNDYLPPSASADDSLFAADVPADVPMARVERYEARTAFDFFSPMGTIATAAETARFFAAHPGNPVLVQEDRVFAVRMSERLPWRWASGGGKADFSGEACRNEYYVWQVGVIAHGSDVANVRLEFSDFVNAETGGAIPRDSATCLNLGGVGWDGKPRKIRVDVPQGRVQALWCGIQIPENARAGLYKGTVRFSADGVAPRLLNVAIRVSDSVLADKGDGDLWRLARLRWLNSTIGIDNHPTLPFKAMKVKGKRIKATDKTLEISDNGLPAAIEINGRQVLARPMTFAVETAGGITAFKAGNLRVSKEADGKVSWSSSSEDGGNLKITCDAWMEYDGYVCYKLRVSADNPVEVKDIRLITTYTPYSSEYYMGAGFGGGRRPESSKWDWQGPYDSYWMGNALAGLHVEFRGGIYNGPLQKDYKTAVPEAWANGGRGYLAVSGQRGQEATVLTSTGPIAIDSAGKEFEFALLITPARPLDTRRQFSQRYVHGNPKYFGKAFADGANVMNIHHATPLNPFINYPFIVRDSLREFVSRQHSEGRKVKLYYTIRELSDHCAEIYALRSLGHEVVVGGSGYGMPWLCEHLVDDYRPAWYTPLDGDVQDASVVIDGFSRWINYYLEGYRWMLENYGIDGLYMDDVAFDRDVMKRLRKIMDRYRPGSLIDLHSNTLYSMGPMNQYTGFFPYVDRLWFGERFNYDEMTPDEWFVTFSGIPFGVMSEMLEKGGNNWLGMVYGASARYKWDGGNPVPVWTMWRDFGIADAKMKGYWDEDCPVETDNPMVKATAYVKPGKVLVSIGNFDNADHLVRLRINWKALGMNPRRATLKAPPLKDFQDAATFAPGDEIPVKAKGGWLLVIE